MKLKGSMKIELTDVNTGEVTTVEHDNMMTDAINNILGLNLLGTLYYFGSTYSNTLNVQDQMARRKELGALANKSLNICCFTGKIKCP